MKIWMLSPIWSIIRSMSMAGDRNREDLIALGADKIFTPLS